MGQIGIVSIITSLDVSTNPATRPPPLPTPLAKAKDFTLSRMSDNARDVTAALDAPSITG
jgi:hypothetical protein